MKDRVSEIYIRRRSDRKTVLVTGAAGFIGSHVADFAANQMGYKVVAVDDLSGGFLRNIPNHTKFVEVDLKNTERVAELFREHGPFAYIYHLAAYAAEGLSHLRRHKLE